MPRKFSFSRSSLARCSSGAYHSRRTRWCSHSANASASRSASALTAIARVVVVRRLVARRELVGAVDRDGERADVVAGRRDVVGEAAVRPAVAVVGLLAQEAEARVVDDDVVALGVRRPEAVDAPRAQRRALRGSRAGAPARRRRARARPGCRGSPGTCPSGPTRGRRTASRCTGRARRAAASTSRAPVNGGVGRSSNAHRDAVRARRLERQQRLARPSPRAARAAAPAARGSRRRARARRFGSSRRETTSTTRLASSTCTVSLPYSGAIFTAVCWREVVAPPISSGSSSRRRSISRATSTIWSSDGVIRPESPTTSTLSRSAVSRICRAGPSRRGRSPRSRCSRARRRRCSCRCRARRP